MRVALLLCPEWDTSFPVSSLAILSAYLKRAGHEPAVYDLNQDMARLSSATDRLSALLGQAESDFRPFPSLRHNWTDRAWVERHILPDYGQTVDAMVERVLAGGARVVGFSVYFSNKVMSLEVARRIKAKAPDVRVVFGGPTCLEFARCLELLREEPVDAVVYGEADKAFPALVDDLERGGTLKARPGVLLRADPATWKDLKDPPLTMDEQPFHDYTVFEGLAHYRGGKTLHTTRGCVRKCSFCADTREMTFRTMSGERVFAEFEHQLAAHPSMVDFILGDSVVNGDIRALDVMSERVAGAGLGISWHGYAIVRKEMTPERVARMRAAGCRVLYYGIESGSERVLRAMNKHVAPELNGRVMLDTKNAGVSATATMIVGHPAETERDFQDTLDWVKRWGEGIRLLTPSLFSINDGSVPPLHWDDGDNTFPVRVERVRRLMRTAAQAGVDCLFEGRVRFEDLEPALEEHLAAYAAAA